MSALAKVQLELFSVDNGLEITESKMKKSKRMKAHIPRYKIGIPSIESKDGRANLSFTRKKEDST